MFLVTLQVESSKNKIVTMNNDIFNLLLHSKYREKICYHIAGIRRGQLVQAFGP